MTSETPLFGTEAARFNCILSIVTEPVVDAARLPGTEETDEATVVPAGAEPPLAIFPPPQGSSRVPDVFEDLF